MTTAIILAGGLGTRLRSVVADVPKPMAPVAGQPFLQHQLDHWIDRGIDKFILSVGYRREAIVEYFGDCYRGIEIAYAVEDEPLGTGGGMLLALECVEGNEPFLLLNGDTFFDVDVSALLAFHRDMHSDLTFALFRANQAERFGGIEADPEGRVTALASAKADVGQLANGGVYAIEPDSLRSRFHPLGKKLSFEDEILPALLADHSRVFGMECHGRFIDIGIPADYLSAAGTILKSARCDFDPTAVLAKNLRASIEAKRRMLGWKEQIDTFGRAVDEVVRRYRQGGRIYIAGNGGSAADAQHLAAEFVSKLARDRAPLPAEALTVDSSILTAIGNDYGYDKLFARQIEGKVTESDIFLGITTSGRSENILEALKTCRRKSIPSIVFCGKDGGPAKKLADYCIIAAGDTTAAVQEIHIVLSHSLCECVELALFPET